MPSSTASASKHLSCCFLSAFAIFRCLLILFRFFIALPCPRSPSLHVLSSVSISVQTVSTSPSLCCQYLSQNIFRSLHFRNSIFGFMDVLLLLLFFFSSSFSVLSLVFWSFVRFVFFLFSIVISPTLMLVIDVYFINDVNSFVLCEKYTDMRIDVNHKSVTIFAHTKTNTYISNRVGALSDLRTLHECFYNCRRGYDNQALFLRRLM